MKEAAIPWEPVPDIYEQPGDRALIAKLLLNEVPPACDALGPRNSISENSFARRKDGRI
jgi:hypothetical protein